jgi:ParB family chromosome partitioning protein
MLDDLSVRQTEALAGKYAGQKPALKRKTAKSAEVLDVERRLRSSLGTQVSLNHKKSGGGTVTIYYYSDEELNSLLEKLT